MIHTEYRIQFLDDERDLIYETRIHSKLFFDFFNPGEFDKYIEMFRYMYNRHTVRTRNCALIAKLFIMLWKEKFIDRRFYVLEDIKRFKYTRITFYRYTI